VKGECNRTLLAVLVARAVTTVEELVVDVGAVQRNETKTVRDELVRDYGGVGFDFYEVDCWGRLAPCICFCLPWCRD